MKVVHHTVDWRKNQGRDNLSPCQDITNGLSWFRPYFEIRIEFCRYFRRGFINFGSCFYGGFLVLLILLFFIRLRYFFALNVLDLCCWLPYTWLGLSSDSTSFQNRPRHRNSYKFRWDIDLATLFQWTLLPLPLPSQLTPLAQSE